MSQLTAYHLIRDRILFYRDINGTSVSASIADRLYTGGPPRGADTPKNATYPFGVLRLINGRTEPENFGEVNDMTLEVEFVDYPHNRGGHRTVENLADIASAALKNWATGSVGTNGNGLLYIKAQTNRDTLPPNAVNAAITRQTFSVRFWNPYLMDTTGSF